VLTAITLFCFAALAPLPAFGAAGDKLWEFEANDAFGFSSPAISPNGTIYVGSQDGNLYALTPNGKEEWAFDTGAIIDSSPAISPNGTIYVGSVNGKLYAVTPAGQKEWEFPTGDDIVSSPALDANGTIFVGSYSDKLYAIRPDGSQKWAFDAGSDIVSSPAVSENGTVYVGSENLTVYAITPSGAKEWEFNASDAVFGSPAISQDGVIYIGSDDSSLYALAPDGSQKWKFSTYLAICSAPAISSNGTIYVGSYDFALYAITPDGQMEWEYLTSSFIESSPAIAEDGTIFVASWDGRVHAVSPDGERKWVFPADPYGDLPLFHAMQASPALAKDGTVYIGAVDNKFYAIEGGAGGLMDSRWPCFHQNRQNTGRYKDGVDPVPNQAPEIIIKETNSTAVSEWDLSTEYGLDNYAPVSSKKAFRASVDPANGVYKFRFELSNKNEKISSLQLVKVSDDNGASRSFGKYAGGSAAADGAWWITDADGNYLDSSRSLAPNRLYFLVFCIQDNGAFDTESSPGAILDPLILVEPDSGASGCVMAPEGGSFLDWLLLALLPLLFALRSTMLGNTSK
jgi:outer membrane protein assembly factor BamB